MSAKSNVQIMLEFCRSHEDAFAEWLDIVEEIEPTETTTIFRQVEEEIQTNNVPEKGN